MKTKYDLIVIFFLMFFVSPKVYSQENYSRNIEVSSNKDSTRNVFVYSSVGLLEIFSLGIGCQVSTDIALSFKYSGTNIGYANFNLPSSGTGVGVKVSYFTKQWIFNNISAEYISYLNLELDRKINSVTKGNYFELNLGYENIDKSKLKIYWAVGFGLSDAKTVSTLFFPSLKIGINYNLF